jgi:D-sedoheptulose 7-phosphate isomerase
MSGKIVREALAEHAALVEQVAREMPDQIERLADLVLGTLTRGGKLLFCGNGGSAADAEHLAAEYAVRFGDVREALAAVALSASSAVLTAAANDLGFERVFERQVRALAEPGDLLVMHSTSGASRNLIVAAEAARDMGVGTAALLAKGGGPLREQVDVAVVVPTDSPARAQELHITIGHVVCELVDRAIAD